MSSDDLAVVRDKDRIVEAKARDGCRDLLDLILAVTARVAGKALVIAPKPAQLRDQNVACRRPPAPRASEAVWRNLCEARAAFWLLPFGLILIGGVGRLSSVRPAIHRGAWPFAGGLRHHLLLGSSPLDMNQMLPCF